MAQYVFTMNRVGKIVPPKRQILKNISLSFFPGAKLGVLSGGEKRRLALSRFLPSMPAMLLPDAPTHPPDAASLDHLEHFLSRFPGTRVAIAHDCYFLYHAAERILEPDRGSCIPW